MSFRTIAAAALAALLAGAAAAGTGYDVRHKDGDGALEHVSQIKLDGLKMAMEMIASGEDAPEGDMIFRADRDPKEMIVVNDEEQWFMSLTAQQVEGGMGAMQAEMNSVMAEVINSMPPEQRAAAMASMGQGGGPMMMGPAQTTQHSLRALGETRSVHGLTAHGYEALEDGARSQVFWAVEPGAFPGGGELARMFDELHAFMMAMPTIGQSIGPLYDREAMDGRVPIEIENFGADGARDSVVTIEPGESMIFAASDFEPDPAYVRRDMFEGMPN